MTSGGESLLNASGRIFIQNSYYFADSPEEWGAALFRLMTEIREIQKRRIVVSSSRPAILVMGSPIYFPNCKIPELLEGAGLRIDRNIEVR